MHKKITTAVNEIGEILLGKERQIRLALSCMIARGHLLIEDLPGMGKTTLSHAIAHALGLSYNRIQFTSDLLPSDILGVNIFDRTKAEFVFHSGPIFSQVVLADEINRATPKAQSALLEAMEERQVSTEGVTRSLPAPFFVIATQNPQDQSGTFPLPESQMDRFLMRLHLGYPAPEAERELLIGQDRRQVMENMSPCLSPEELLALQEAVPKIKVSDSLLDYLQRIIAYTRQYRDFGDGLSPRGGLAVLRSAQSWALCEGRNHVLPDDIQEVLPSVVEHRLKGSSQFEHAPLSQKLIENVPVV